MRGAAGAIGYRVGAPGEGLACMFHMMNEARIGVGLGATMLGMAGYEASLDYARNRPQGRPATPAGKNPAQPQVPLIEHADVKRMLLAQKSWCEGALALELYCARQVDEANTGDEAAAAEAKLLLEMLTPVAKSFPSEWCLEANSLAIQVLGGYGYTRDFPVEQYWRDNRLNMIHEGTHGIQALDLLGRKVTMLQGRGLALVAARAGATIERALAVPALADDAAALAEALRHVVQAAGDAWSTGDPAEALANATPYLQAFGHVIVGWMWLDVALCAGAGAAGDAAGSSAGAADGHGAAAGAAQRDGPGADAAVAQRRGKLAAARYFFHYELPRVAAWLAPVERRDDTCRTMEDAWF